MCASPWLSLNCNDTLTLFLYSLLLICINLKLSSEELQSLPDYKHHPSLIHPRNSHLILCYWLTTCFSYHTVFPWIFLILFQILTFIVFNPNLPERASDTWCECEMCLCARVGEEWRRIVWVTWSCTDLEHRSAHDDDCKSSVTCADLLWFPL